MICLVVTGEYQASRQISPVQALWSTRYGVFLLVKVALVAVMLAAALLAERHVMGAAVPGRLVRAVRRSVGIDTTRRGAQAMTLHILTAAGAPGLPARPLVEAYLAHLGPARARQFLVHDARDS